jgi:hypothetical protein
MSRGSNPGGSVTVPDAPSVHLYVTRGWIDLETEGRLNSGDAARLTAARARRVVALESSEAPIWEMHVSLGSSRK